MTHPMTESARRVFPPNHEYAGYIQPPRKSDVEGGPSFRESLRFFSFDT